MWNLLKIFFPPNCMVTFPSHLKKLCSKQRFWHEKLNCGFFHSFLSSKYTTKQLFHWHFYISKKNCNFSWWKGSFLRKSISWTTKQNGESNVCTICYLRLAVRNSLTNTGGAIFWQLRGVVNSFLGSIFHHYLASQHDGTQNWWWENVGRVPAGCVSQQNSNDCTKPFPFVFVHSAVKFCLATMF